MRDRSPLAALLLIGLVVPFVGCTSSPSLTSISVTPTSMNFGGTGLQAQLTATGSYTHPGHPPVIRDITDQVAWASSAVECVTVSNTGMITSGGNICTNILVTASMPGFNGLISGTMTVNVTQPGGGGGGGNIVGDVTSITIIPGSQTVASLNQTSQFIAIGKTSSGVTVDVTDLSAWTSSNEAVATVTNAGLATALSSGTSTITALFINQDGTAATGSAVLTVSPSASPEPLASLAIIPASQSVLAINQTSQYIAIGTTSTGITEDLTNTCAWTSTIESVGTISATGLATSVGPGSTAIIAEAKNPDGSVVTGTASFTVSVSKGSSGEPLVSLAIVPASQTAFAIGQTAQFLAIGTTGTGSTVDVTAQATWGSSNVSVGTIGKTTGLATAVSAGSTAITAEANNPDGTIVSGSASFTVQQSSTTEQYVSLSILPASQTALALNQTSQFIAIATTGAGNTVNVTNTATWASSSVQVATIGSGTGLATAVGSGVTAITAILPNKDGTVVTGSATYTVNIPSIAEPVVSLQIVPGSQTASAAGETAQYIAIGTTGTGTTEDLTDQATWSSSDVNVATINGATGLATAVGNGTTAITAIVKNPDGTAVVGTAAYSVTISKVTEPYVGMIILPGSQAASSVGETAQYIAIATTGTGTTIDVTTMVTWNSSDVSVGTINSATGVATAAGNGTTAITAILPNGDGTVVTGSATFNVTVSSTTESLISLQIIPTSQSVSTQGETAQYIAIGTFSGSAAKTTSFCNATGTMQDCTSYVTWHSSDTAIATISSNGLATGLDLAGSTAITAIGKNTDGTLVTGAASFTQSLTGSGTPTQATLGVTLLGTGASSGVVTAPAPGTVAPNVINCSSAPGAVCSQTFPVGSTVTLTAPAPPAGTTFGGWSSNCASTTGPINPTGTNSCQVTLGENQAVGAIFY